MDSVMRVHELAEQLGLNQRELLHLLRDLDIPVKSHMSGLSDDDVALVREKYAEKRAHEEASEVVQKRVQPGVIVRRRKKVEVPPKAPAEKPMTSGSPAPEKASPETATPRRVTPESRPSEGISPEKPGVVKPSPEKFTSARIITPGPAPEPEPAAAAPGTPVEEKIDTDRQSRPEAVPAADSVSAKVETLSEPVATEPLDFREPEGAGLAPSAPAVAPEGQEKRPRPAARKKSAQPAVKIISKPQVPETRPKRAAAETPAETQDQDSGAAKRKKKRKGKVVVDFTVRTPEEARDVSLEFKRRKGSTIQDRTGGRVRPGRRGAAPRKLDEKNITSTQPIKAAKRKIKVEEAIRVLDLARQMGVKASEVMKVLLNLGVMATINHTLDIDTAAVVAAEFHYEVEKTGFSEAELLVPRDTDKPEDLQHRSPVVTIMGHVDHGKTSLLDAIRRSDITSGEAGGITQHIGAYLVKTPKGNIVFLDTPGHEAFTAMRARGAQVTDLVILVVAADDGVTDQTREAVNQSKAAGVPILVAVNKIDKEGADPDRVKRELADLGLVPEEWGGDTIFANVSAKQKIGLDEMLELVQLQAEVLELKANPDKPAAGHIIEARLDKGRGPVATVLIQEGTLKKGDTFVCGLFSGKVRAMFDDQGKPVKKAGPSTPVEVQGFDGVPDAGDEFISVEDDKLAKRVVSERRIKQREKDLAKEKPITLESFMASKAAGEAKVLNLVVKTDVQGSLEAIVESVNKLSTDQVRVHVIHGGIGAISESDILLANASSAIVLGFNVRPSAKIREIAEKEGIEVRFYDIIYHLVNELKDAMTGMLEPVIREVYLGQAEVLETFSVPKVGTVAGCTVADGKLMRNAGVRLLRDGVVIYTGRLSSLKRFKEDVREVLKGYECGVGLERFNDIRVGDIIEAYEEVAEKATLH